jgi:hypothetical protein
MIRVMRPPLYDLIAINSPTPFPGISNEELLKRDKSEERAGQSTRYSFYRFGLGAIVSSQ